MITQRRARLPISGPAVRGRWGTLTAGREEAAEGVTERSPVLARHQVVEKWIDRGADEIQEACTRDIVMDTKAHIHDVALLYLLIHSLVCLYPYYVNNGTSHCIQNNNFSAPRTKIISQKNGCSVVSTLQEKVSS